MTNRLEFYRCEICGNIIQVLHSGAGNLICCGKPMKLLQPQTNDDANKEKHVPVFLENNLIKIGSVPHPMTKEHHIDFVEVSGNKNILIHFFNPEDKPEFDTKQDFHFDCAIEYCNIHGLWKNR